MNIQHLRPRWTAEKRDEKHAQDEGIYAIISIRNQMNGGGERVA